MSPACGASEREENPNTTLALGCPASAKGELPWPRFYPFAPSKTEAWNGGPAPRLVGGWWVGCRADVDGRAGGQWVSAGTGHGVACSCDGGPGSGFGLRQETYARLRRPRHVLKQNMVAVQSMVSQTHRRHRRKSAKATTAGREKQD